MTHEKTQHTLVLAIHPTARGFGFAVFEEPQSLVDWGSTTVRLNKNTSCLKKICSLINFYSPDVVIVEDCEDPGFRKSKSAKKLIQHILSEGQKRNIQTSKYSRSTIKGVFSQFHVTTRFQIAKKIVEWLPSLQARLPPERKPWMSEDYRMGIFDAVALALTFYYLND